MVRVIMHGCNGRMGQVITEMIAKEAEMEIVAGVDLSDHIQNSYPVFKSMKDCNVEADVVIDFANAKAVDGLLDTCVAKSLPCVLCTTGLSEEQLAHVKEASGKVAILRSANMSMGINLLMKLLKDAVPVLAAAGYDMEIVEKHHNQKLDAPSGTAIALADVMNQAAGGDYEYVYDRSTRREKRPEKEIGISAVRGGTIVGDHDVIFAGQDEVITFSHMAYSRKLFATGAVSAAKFLAGKPAGMYDMSRVNANGYFDAMDADVISFEASRGDLVVLDAIHDAHFETEAGPGVYDIHSPRIPSEKEIEDRIYEILDKMDVKKVWINPDCGLKTRGNAETWPSLENLVAAAKAVRAKLDK